MPREYDIELTWPCGACKKINRGRDKICSSCGAPKKDIDSDLDPTDTSFENRVTDRSLMAQAEAGADFKCRYCGSAQRRDNGNCAQCGSDQKDSVPKAELVGYGDSPFKTPTPELLREIKNRRYKKKTPSLRIALTVFGVVATGILLFWIFKPLRLHGKVTKLAWQRTIAIDRYTVHHHSGFVMDDGAFNTKDLGPRYHYTNYHVLIGHHEVPDTYVCGKTNCRRTPKVCGPRPAPVCVKKKNGFANCTQGDADCTGGDMVCDDKLCPTTRTVNDYADIPVDDEYYEWDLWQWAHDRNLVASGSVEPVVWPEVDHPTLQEGEREQEGGRAETYNITFTGRKGDSWDYDAKGVNEFNRYRMGSRYLIKVTLGTVTPLEN